MSCTLRTYTGCVDTNFLNLPDYRNFSSLLTTFFEIVKPGQCCSSKNSSLKKIISYLKFMVNSVSRKCSVEVM